MAINCGPFKSFNYVLQDHFHLGEEWQLISIQHSHAGLQKSPLGSRPFHQRPCHSRLGEKQLCGDWHPPHRLSQRLVPVSRLPPSLDLVIRQRSLPGTLQEWAVLVISWGFHGELFPLKLFNVYGCIVSFLLKHEAMKARRFLPTPQVSGASEHWLCS